MHEVAESSGRRRVQADAPERPALLGAALGWPVLWLWALLCVAAAVAGRGARRGGAALWRSLRPYGTASWRHPPRGA